MNNGDGRDGPHGVDAAGGSASDADRGDASAEPGPCSIDPCTGPVVAATPDAWAAVPAEPFAEPNLSPIAGTAPLPLVPLPADPTPRRFAAPAGPRTHRWGLGAYALAEAFFIGASVLVSFLLPDAPPAGLLAVAILVPTGLAAAVAIAATITRGGGPAADLRLGWSWHDVRLGIGYGFLGLLVTLPASMIYVAIAGPDTSSAVGEVFGDVRAGPVAVLMVFAVLVLVAPLCEEIVYRGLLWGGLERIGASPWVAFAVTTLLFALAHFEFARTPLLLVVAVPIGLVRLHTGRLLPSIVAHQINNLLPGIVLAVGLLGAPLPVT